MPHAAVVGRQRPPTCPRPPARRARRRAGPVPLLLAVLLLAACGSDGADRVHVVGPPAPAATVEPASTGTAGRARVALPAEVVDLPPPALDPAALTGLVVEESVTGTRADHRDVATVSAPGAPALERVLGELVDAEVQRYEDRLVPGSENELTIGVTPALAAGSVLGISVGVRSRTGDLPAETTTTGVHTDLASGAVWTSAELVADPDLAFAWFTDAVGRQDLGHALLGSTAALSDLRFGADGSLTAVVGLGDGRAEPYGDVAVRIAPHLADGVLTDAGRLVRDAAVAAAPFTGVPVPGPDPVREPPAAAESAPPPEPPPPEPAPVPEPTPAPAAPGPSPPPGPDVDCGVLACVALTFDDGPGPYTALLLDELRAADVRATFFVVGRAAAARPDLVREAVADGHAVGNHTWSHPRLPDVGAVAVADQLDRTTAVLADLGVTTPLMRPPYGATDATVASVTAARGYAQIMWDVDTQDWRNRDVAVTTQRALAGAHPGAIVLMHDIHPSTVEAVPGIVDALRAEGYTLVTVPELLGSDLEPGRAYVHR